MSDYYQLLFQYRMAINELEAFMASEEFAFIKGYLRNKVDTRKYKDKTYKYNNLYFVSSVYFDGKEKKKYIYVKKGQEEDFRRKVAKKRENRKKYKELKANVKRICIQLKKQMRGNKELWKEIENAAKKQEEFREDKKGVISALGERLRSRGEGIISSIAYALKIQYVYEMAITLMNCTIHPDFALFINGKKILLEFLGMADDKDYLSKWRKKENTYRKNGYYIGKNLVCIACNNKQEINIQKITQVLFDLKEGQLPQGIVYV